MVRFVCCRAGVYGNVEWGSRIPAVGIVSGMALRPRAFTNAFLSLVAMGGVARAQCTGDVDGDGHVAIDELSAGVRGVLSRDWSAGLFGIDDLVEAVHNALTGCDVFRCSAGAPFEPWKRAWPDASVAETTAGANGVFADVCGRAGHLIQWTCALETHCKRDPINLRCTTLETGMVEPHLVECADCVDGTCPSLRCPHASDVVRYLAIGEDATLFENESDRRRYRCVPEPQPLASRCRRTPAVGDRERIVALWVHDEYCVDTDFGHLTLANGCPYFCGVATE